MIAVRQGSIYVDGQDIANFSAEDVRSRVNAVPQDSFLFPASFRQNLDPVGCATDNEIQHALEKIRLWGIINEKGGHDEKVDTDAWSAGQKQLLCFARAIVRGGKILVLDEATSNVDSESEGLIEELVESEFKGTTVLSVMHRLSHVMKYDKVLVMDKGRVVEFGKPSALLKKKSKFAELYKSAP